MREFLIQLLAIIYLLQLALAALQALILAADCAIGVVRSVTEFCLDVRYAWHHAGHEVPDYSEE